MGEVPSITAMRLRAIVLIDRAPSCFSPNSCVKCLLDRTCSTGSWKNEKAEHPTRIHFFLMRLLQSYLILTFLAFVLPKPPDKRFAYWDCARALPRAQGRSQRFWLGSILKFPLLDRGRAREKRVSAQAKPISEVVRAVALSHSSDAGFDPTAPSLLTLKLKERSWDSLQRPRQGRGRVLPSD
jgi:hypothetical protein